MCSNAMSSIALQCIRTWQYVWNDLLTIRAVSAFGPYFAYRQVHISTHFQSFSMLRDLDGSNWHCNQQITMCVLTQLLFLYPSSNLLKDRIFPLHLIWPGIGDSMHAYV